MKIYWVLAWDSYYPKRALDNVEGRFETYEEACEYANTIMRNFDNVEIENILPLIS